MTRLAANYIPCTMFQLENAARGFYRLTGLSNMNELTKLRHPVDTAAGGESAGCCLVVLIICCRGTPTYNRSDIIIITFALRQTNFPGNRCKSILFAPSTNRRHLLTVIVWGSASV